MSVIGDLAEDIMEYEFDNDTTITNTLAVSGWLVANLGQLNTLIYKDFSGEDAALDTEAASIFKEVYIYNFYNKQTRNSLRGIGSTGDSSSILSLRDGESSVSFVNRNEVAKVYRGLTNESKAKLDGLVAQYNIYEAQPQQVGGLEAGTYSDF